MRDYLQRMAASVLSRERAVHPIVGSLWASRHDVNPMEAPGETFVSGEDARHAQDGARHQPNDAGTARGAQEHHGVWRASAFVPIAETVESPPNPRLPGAAPQHVSFRGETRLIEQGDGEVSSQREASQHQASPQQPKRIFTPLLQARLPQTSQQSISPPISGAAGQADHRADGAGRQPQANAPAHEPDAIEIHIGRVEVLAAPPQQQRAPAPAPRKSLDLGEYLSRGGRAR